MTNKERKTAETNREKLLTVVPKQLMHTGGFYNYLLGYIPKLFSNDPLCFGVCTTENPEDNTSIADYSKKNSTRHNRSIHWITTREATAVYEPGYHKRIDLDQIAINYVEKCEDDKDRDGNFIFRAGYLGDVKTYSPLKYIFNFEKIQALICYSIDDAIEYQRLLGKRELDIPIYVEERSKNPNPEETSTMNFQYRLFEDNLREEYVKGGDK
jgi:hypothetical protein